MRDERVAGDLMDDSRLKRRITAIPLNRIQAKTLSKDKLAQAQAIAAGNSEVHLALELVGYPGAVEAAMRYVFGSTLICSGTPITSHPIPSL